MKPARFIRLWPAADPEVLPHRHDDLAQGDPHWDEGGSRHGRRHAHAFVIDGHHHVWPHGS